MNPCAELQTGLSTLFQCDAMGDRTRVRTPFLYPDGDIIDLFARERPNGTIEISDLGETVGWLRTQTLSPRRSKKQQALLEDVALTHGVEFFKGEILARCAPGTALTPVLLRVAQAAVRVSDLWFTFQTRAVQTVNDEVAEFLEERKIQFQRSERLVGRSGRIWNPDFHTRTERASSLIYVLATGSRAAARGVSNAVLAAWYDLSQLSAGPEGLRFVSLFDDTMDVWSDEDYRLLEGLSSVARWSGADELERILTLAA